MRGLLIVSIIALWGSISLANAYPKTACTGYSSQSQCDPPSLFRLPRGLRASDLPACGRHSNATSSQSRFLVIGDYGLSGNCEAQVSVLVKKLAAQFGAFDFVFNTGDNNYWSGNCDSFANNVGQYFGDFYTPSSTCTDPNDSNLHQIRHDMAAARTQATSRPSANVIRFFPTLGNHDYDSFKNYPDKLPYLQYFGYLSELPPSDVGMNGQWYTYTPVPGVQLFSVNSNLGSPSASPGEQALFQQQTQWLQHAVTSSNATYKFVYFHHPPYCTAQHDPLAPWMDLPYKKWGVSAVFAGHEHVYERLHVNDMTYIVNGLGGHPWLYEIFNCAVETGSQVRHNAAHGAMIGLINSVPTPNGESLPISMDICFYSVADGGTLVDYFSL